MRRRVRNQLAAIVVVALIVVATVWFLTTRQVFFQNTTLAQIDYSPASPPYLTFTFSSPLIPSQVAGTTAVLKSFAVGATSPTGAAAAAPFLALLVSGANGQGPAPFVPEYTSADPSVISTNTLPAGASTFAEPMTITGQGMMWFALPMKR
jgi:hypothetical protein